MVVTTSIGWGTCRCCNIHCHCRVTLEDPYSLLAKTARARMTFNLELSLMAVPPVVVVLQSQVCRPKLYSFGVCCHFSTSKEHAQVDCSPDMPARACAYQPDTDCHVAMCPWGLE